MRSRTLLASAACLGGAWCMQSWSGNPPWQLWIPTALLGVAAVAVHRRRTDGQLLGRAVLWSNLLLAAVVAWVGNHHDQAVAAALAGLTGAGLLALGRRGLDGEHGDFAPVAFRATLVALLVMALADAQTLLFFGTVIAEDGPSGDRAVGVVALGLAGLLAVAVAGLYRLRAWGLLADGLACAGIIAVVALGGFPFLGLFRVAFVATAALQLVLALPLWAALARGGAAARPTLSRGGVWLGSLAVAALIAVAVWPALGRLL